MPGSEGESRGLQYNRVYIYYCRLLHVAVGAVGRRVLLYLRSAVGIRPQDSAILHSAVDSRSQSTAVPGTA